MHKMTKKKKKSIAKSWRTLKKATKELARPSFGCVEGHDTYRI